MHGHVGGFLKAAQARPDVQIVGIFEPDAALLRQYAARHGLADAVLFTDLNAMLDRAKPEAVASFTNTFDHPAVVEAAAARHIHVMMEKPLAVSNADAQRIRRAAERRDPGPRELRDDVVPESRRDLDPDQGTPRRR